MGHLFLNDTIIGGWVELQTSGAVDSTDVNYSLDVNVSTQYYDLRFESELIRHIIKHLNTQ